MSNIGKDLPEGITLQDLQNNFNTARAEYAPALRRMHVLRLADSGKIWEMIAKSFPEFSITPDTNYVNYIKENILSSVYTIGRNAEVQPRKQEHLKLTQDLNAYLDTFWGILGIKNYQMQAGEKAALLNLGVTQVGWNKDIVDGTTDAWFEGNVTLKDIDPQNYMRDPFASKLDDAGYVIYHDMYHKTALQNNPDYAEMLKDYTPDGETMELAFNKETGKNPSSDRNYLYLVIQWVKVFDKKKNKVVIHEIHTIANKYVLLVREDIQPSMYPFAELFCNMPGKDPIGVSEPAKILSNTVVANLLDGMVVSQAYKALRPIRLVSASSGLNIPTFSKYGNEPDMLFVVNRVTEDAVRYVQPPQLPQGIENVALRIGSMIQMITGIDAKYTGKDTGSILTTGGIDSMLAQATMRDTTHIALYEQYTQRLTMLVLGYTIEHADKRKFISRRKDSIKPDSFEIDFPKVSRDIVFNYAINISPETPKNKQRIADSATMVLEKSLQYQANPPLITPEEWLMYQDFPQKDLILDRLKVDRSMNATEKVTEILAMFSNLVEQGMSPQDAIDAIVQQLEAEQSQGATGGGTPPPQAAAGMAPTQEMAPPMPMPGPGMPQQ